MDSEIRSTSISHFGRNSVKCLRKLRQPLDYVMLSCSFPYVVPLTYTMEHRTTSITSSSTLPAYISAHSGHESKPNAIDDERCRLTLSSMLAFRFRKLQNTREPDLCTSGTLAAKPRPYNNHECQGQLRSLQPRRAAIDVVIARPIAWRSVSQTRLQRHFQHQTTTHT